MSSGFTRRIKVQLTFSAQAIKASFLVMRSATQLWIDIRSQEICTLFRHSDPLKEQLKMQDMRQGRAGDSQSYEHWGSAALCVWKAHGMPTLTVCMSWAL